MARLSHTFGRLVRYPWFRPRDGRSPTVEARRSYEAAAGGRRWSSAPTAFQPNASILAGASATRARVRSAVANNAHAAKALDVLSAAIAGRGIRPQSEIEDPELRGLFNAAFTRWAEQADADNLGDFFALTASMVEGMVRDGEALAVMEVADDTGALCLRQLAPEQLDASITREMAGGGRIVAGVEFDGRGRRVAYHILPDAPDLPIMRRLTPERVPASEVIHLFRKSFPGQVRGISWFAPVLLRLAEIDQMEDAQIVRQKIGAMLTGFVLETDGAGSGMDDLAAPDGLAGGLEPGTLKVLRPGQDVRFSDPPNIGAEANQFQTMQLRAVAAGIGITYEQLTGDYSATNYSSARAALLEFRRQIERTQHHVVIHQLCRPVWRRWATLEILAGRLTAPDFERDPEAYLAARWITPGWPWVDPQKEIAAQRDAVAAGFMSRREVVAGRGLDIETLDREIRDDEARNPMPANGEGETA